MKGILVDSLTHESEPYATIRITLDKSPEKPVRMNVTDAKGKFQEKLPQTGNYTLQITSVGKRTVVRRFTITNNQRVADLGTLYTCDDTQMLKGVEVVAQKPLVKAEIDKISYSIEDDPDSKTNTTLEMLRKVPLVTVDGEDNIQSTAPAISTHLNLLMFRFVEDKISASISWFVINFPKNRMVSYKTSKFRLHVIYLLCVQFVFVLFYK